MGSLVIKHLVKYFGKNAIVDDVSFSVADGEFFVLLGPSGSGKSTLLRLICGLEQPDSGEIIVDQRDITQLSPRERNLGMVFQDYGLYPNMNVYDNIAYGLQARGVNRAEIQQRIEPAAEKLGLTELLNKVVVDLSGGEQQRVALARALVKDADVYLYDEPLSNLDPKLRHKARRDITAVHREKRKPSVYVTHDQAEALAMGDRIAVLAKGKLQQIGTAEELINAPASLFVAGFIGSPPVNLLNGVIKETNGHFLTGDGFRFPLPEKWLPLVNDYTGKAVIAGIRPDTLALAGSPVEFAVSEWNTLTGTVTFVEALLGETIVGLQIGQNTNLTAAFQEFVEAEPGDTLKVVVDLDRLMLFDPDSELSLLDRLS